MSKYQHFEELPVWMEAATLYNKVLDLLENPGFKASSGFRNQLDRAALSVSNNIAEGFERITIKELLSFIGIARGSSGEVRSMLLVVKDRSAFKPYRKAFMEIVDLAKSCCRQLTAWFVSVEDSPVSGKRHLAGEMKQRREAYEKYREDRRKWFRSITPKHPLYNSREAKEARGEDVE